MNAELKLAGICLAADQYPISETYFRDVTKKNPRNNVIALQGLSATLIKQRRYFEAVIEAKKALAIDKNDTGSQLLHATAVLDFVMQFPDPLSHLLESC